ncbi:class I adenylate-forming enzyme family protein [Camelimonas abortus]|uniref:Class I adenylate-forming enzyme family protein n=1 Tax=Camelimonas abortus TaxID=1017184 RepID=A0ABV7LEV4_9HYPH
MTGMSAGELLERDFGLIADLVAAHARERPQARAVAHRGRSLTYGEFNALADRVAAALQREGLKQGDVIAICALSSIPYAVTFIGALRAGVVVTPLAPSSTREQLQGMVQDAGARLFFVDQDIAGSLGPFDWFTGRLVALDDAAPGAPWSGWLAQEGARPQPVEIPPEAPFNIIYSSGTTGLPKGIVQSHRMRWAHVQRGASFGYGPEAVTIVSTPLYSNTTLVSFLPTLTLGGAVVLMEKFDARGFLELAQQERATHAMLVPVQYRRIMALPDFDSYDLSSFVMKFCTSAPFHADLKADVLKRWPGGLIEYYGMTEGGGGCSLVAHQFPHKLHTVGRPNEGHVILLLDENGDEVPPGEVGEIVGYSPAAVMNGYHNQPEKTREAIWIHPDGRRFIRTGDVGRFDEDGFLILMDRKKDMIISGGFNVYPSDIEAVLMTHPDVSDVAVVGVPSEAWGETPVAFVVAAPGRRIAPQELRAWANERLGKVQRLAGVMVMDQLPRSAIGKILKRELRDSWAASGQKVA